MQIHTWIILHFYGFFIGSTMASQTNLLLRKTTSQSSDHSDFSTSDKVVDGNTNGVYGQSCMHSRTTTNEWWMVDLGSTQCIGKVSIYNRVDCCGERLVSAVIRIGQNSNRDNPECGTVTLDQTKANQKIDFTCNMRGRYLSIHLPSGLLQLCEVQAFVGECCRQNAFKKHNAQKFANHMVKELKARSKIDCAATCLSLSNQCISFNWKEIDKTCQLNNARKGDFPSDISSSVDWIHYDHDGECAQVTCANGGRCEPTCGSGHEDRFVCHCKVGFTGQLCQIPEACTDSLEISTGVGQILVSSGANTASNIILSNSIGWSAAASDTSPWVKVHFLALIEVTGIVTKGGPTSGGWVTKYKIAYDDVRNSYKPVEYKDQAGTIQTFTANSNIDTEVKNWLVPFITTTAITLTTLSCQGTCGLRLDILGCKHQESCSSESKIGWAVQDRINVGNVDAVHTWVTPKAFSCHGVVSHWRFWSGRSVPWRALVLRNVDDTHYDIIGINDIPAGATEQKVTYQVPDNERIVVQTGDVIGLAWNSPAVKHVTQGKTGDSDVVLLKSSNSLPDSLNVGDRIDASGVKSHPTRAYSIKAIMSDWTVAFKGATENNRNMLADWTHLGEFTNADGAHLWKDAAKNYRNNFIYNSWNSLSIQKAKITLLDSQGFVLADVVFNAVGTSTSSWFEKAKLLTSPWTDLPSAPTNYFSIAGHTSGSGVARHFFINRKYGGCSVDAGWLCVLDTSDNCAWGKGTGNFPKIVYSKQATYVTWNNAAKGTASTFMIFVLNV